MRNRRTIVNAQRVIVVEDDIWESDYVKALIQKAYPSVGVEQLYSEAEFHQGMPGIVANPPAALVLDIALPLGNIDVEQLGPNVSDIEGEGRDAIAYNAGLRCLKLLRQNAATRNIPTILHTIYTRSNFPDMPAESGNLILITKQEQYGRLLKAIGSFLSLAGADIQIEAGILAVSRTTQNIQRDVFVIMPFDGKHVDTFEAIKRSISKASRKLRVTRIDEKPGAFPVVPEIKAAIEECDIVICDLSEERPNVYFELGFSEGVKKPAICVARAGTKLHFDVAGLNVLFFATYKEMEERLTKEVKLTVLDLGLGKRRRQELIRDMHRKRNLR